MNHLKQLPLKLSFLRDLNLAELIGIFQEEQLTMEDILEMNNHELKLIGVEKHKQRKAILQVILCQRHSNFYFLTLNNTYFVEKSGVQIPASDG